MPSASPSSQIGQELSPSGTRVQGVSGQKSPSKKYLKSFKPTMKSSREANVTIAAVKSANAGGRQLRHAVWPNKEKGTKPIRCKQLHP
eukprot:5194739-Amphidinium_carterae.1